jgi:crotonobetainyl-CoA:carnitine CoA-transferase CaiB-like acyl-CoA transferase
LLPADDFGAFWAQSGLMDITKSGEESPPPREPGGIGDYNTGMQLLGGVFAALYDREKTGRGQLVDASLMRAGIWSMAQPLASLMAGNRCMLIPHHETFSTTIQPPYSSTKG